MATSGVNVKMGVSGISQFKQNINSAKTSLKTLDAQLELTEKQYKATGDQEQYMKDKAELLMVKMEEQKAIVRQAEQALEQMAKNGVDKGSKAFQTMQQELLKAKGDLLDTQTQLDGVAESSETAGENVSQMNLQMQNIGKNVSWDNVTEGLKSITDGMEAVITKAWQVGQAIVTNTLGAGAWADELQTTAAQWEISPERLQRMRKTEQLIDTSTETILSSQDKLRKGLEGADKEVMGAFAYLGIDPTEMSWEDAFWAAGEAIAKLGSEEDKVKYSTKLFGKSWRELLPLFQTGRDQYEETMESWHVVSQEQIDSMGKMDDQYQRMQGEWETFKTTLWATFSGPLTKGMEVLTGLLEKLNEYLASPEGQAMMQKFSDTMTDLVEDLMNIDPEQVIGGLEAVFDKLMEGLKWLADPENMAKVENAIKIFIGAWAGLKAAEGASIALKLFSGLKGIGIGGGGTAVATGGGGAVTAGIGTKLAATGSAIKGFLAAGGGASMLAPAAVLAAVLGGTEMANRWDLSNLEAQRAARLEKAGQLGGVNGDWMAKAANALGVLRDESGNPLKNIFGGANLESDYAAQGNLLLAMSSRGTIEKAKLLASLAGKHTSAGYDAQMELLRYWESGGKGEEWTDARTAALLETVTDSYETMATRVDALAVTSEKEAAASEKLTDAAELLETLPDRLDSAVRDGLAGITIILDGQKVGEAVTETVSWGMAGIVQKMTK